MSFGLSRGRSLDGGDVAVAPSAIPPMPDDVLTRPDSARLDPRAFFPIPDRPLQVEIGSGKGTFLLNAARAEPHVNFLGFEYAREFFLYACDRLRRAGLTNVRMLGVDATEFFRWRLPDACATDVHLYYSDPWPKTRHHKNRVMQHAFLAECFRVLAPGGALRIVTDHDDLWTWCTALINAWTTPHATPPWPAAIAATLPPDAAPFSREAFVPPPWVGEGAVVATNYEKKMCDAVGKQPHACVLRRWAGDQANSVPAGASAAAIGNEHRKGG